MPDIPRRPFAAPDLTQATSDDYMYPESFAPASSKSERSGLYAPSFPNHGHGHIWETRVIVFKSPFDVLITTIFLSAMLLCFFCCFYYFIKKLRKLQLPADGHDSGLATSTSTPAAGINEDVTINVNDEVNRSGSTGSNSMIPVTPTDLRCKRIRGPRELNVPLHLPELKFQTPKSNIRAPGFAEIVPVPTPPPGYWGFLSARHFVTFFCSLFL